MLLEHESKIYIPSVGIVNLYAMSYIGINYQNNTIKMQNFTVSKQDHIPLVEFGKYDIDGTYNFIKITINALESYINTKVIEGHWIEVGT